MPSGIYERNIPYNKICKVCHKEFIAYNNKAEFCSSVCKHRYNYLLKNEYYKNKNKERYYKNRKLISKLAKRKNEEIKNEVLSHYSNGTMKCACCGENIIEFLTIDHIDGGGTEHRKKIKKLGTVFYRWLIKNKFPLGFQVLCMNCNFGKRINKGRCPHGILLYK